MSGGINSVKRSRDVIEYNGERIVNQWQPRVDFPRGVGATRVFFDDIEQELLRVLAEHATDKVVVGCVAWLSNPRILQALSRCKFVLILVNYEDYATWGRGRALPLYAQMKLSDLAPADVFRLQESPMAFIKQPLPSVIWALRGGSARDIMHSKYLVFFELERETQTWMPQAVWTGSFNFTKHASCNAENALFIRDEALAEAYFYDFANSFKHAEPIQGTATGGTRGESYMNQATQAALSQFI